MNSPVIQHKGDAPPWTKIRRFQFSNPAFRDELSEVVRDGAQQIIRQAVEAELEAFLEEHSAERDGRGRRSVVRNGYLPLREVLTGIGPVGVRVPRTRDRSGAGRCFRSELLPPYLKKTRRVEAVVPWLYLKGVSTNDFEEALQALFGESVKGLSAASVARLKGGWEVEYARWRERDWGSEEFVYLWADGIYVNVRSEERRCLLVVVGCDVRGCKHFLALDAGFRESKESWKAVLLSLRDRGVKAAKLAVGDGCLGFWSALAEVYPETRAQRCRVHKTANVLDKLPKRLQGSAKSMLHEIWRADTRARAEEAFKRFVGHLRSQIPQGRRLPGQGSGDASVLLRLPGGSLAASADYQPHRIDLRDHTAANGEDQELPEREDGVEPRASTRHERPETLASATRLPSSGRRGRRREVHRWD